MASSLLKSQHDVPRAQLWTINKTAREVYLLSKGTGVCQSSNITSLHQARQLLQWIAPNCCPTNLHLTQQVPSKAVVMLEFLSSLRVDMRAGMIYCHC